MTQVKPEHVGVIVLAAGSSERMKELKAFLPYDDNTMFIEKILSTYSGWGCSEIVVVTNQEAYRLIKQTVKVPSTVKMVINDHLELERFYSVKLGLGAIRTSSFCFIQNVDNPFIDARILDRLYAQRNDRSYISPVYKKKGGHPVLLNREIIDRIGNWPDDSANLKEVLGTIACTPVEMPDDRVLININSAEEYDRFFK
ncbi:MAG: NTP transferase domain-containing protein [Bacteroidota bacterium]